jgi:hypothetical protein
MEEKRIRPGELTHLQKRGKTSILRVNIQDFLSNKKNDDVVSHYSINKKKEKNDFV